MIARRIVLSGLVSALVLPTFTDAVAQGVKQRIAIEHLEPPQWWVGMKNPRLELMVHGQDIAALQPRIKQAGVTLVASTHSTSPNYLFIDLDISAQMQPASFSIEFLRGNAVVASYEYKLLPRSPGSAQREGFSSRDAIYLVVPDRFANGDVVNDTVAGMGDPANRSEPGGRHGGDLQGLQDKLDYIAGMGFTQVWSTPLMENKLPRYSYHGYSATDLYKIDPRFGSNEQYRQLVATARAKGLGFIQDIVPNHIGSSHWWMNDLPAPDWINGSSSGYVETNHRHTTQLDSYAAPSDRERLTDGWFVPTMPDLNQRNPHLATYLVQNAIWWIEYAGLSGLRVDTFPYSDKVFLTRWSKAIMDEYPNFSMVGEEMSNNPLVVAQWLRGFVSKDGYTSCMPSMMDFPLHGLLRDALTEPEGHGYGTGLGKLYEAMVNDQLYPQPSRLVLFEGNHDTNRIFSALGEDADLNRMAMTFIATTVRTPQFFYGSEILMTSPIQRSDGLVRADFPGGWPDDAVNAVTGQNLSPQQRAAQAYLRKLLNWRKGSEAVQQGKLMHYAPLDGVYVYFRYTPTQKVMVVLNKNQQATRLATTRFAEMLTPQSSGRDVISGEEHALGQSLQLPARSTLVMEVRP